MILMLISLLAIFGKLLVMLISIVIFGTVPENILKFMKTFRTNTEHTFQLFQARSFLGSITMNV